MNKLKMIGVTAIAALTITLAPALGATQSSTAEAAPSISVQTARHCGVKRIGPTLPFYHPACWNIGQGGNRDPRCDWRTVPDCR